MRYKKALTAVMATVLGLAAAGAHAAEKRTLCVFDIIGASGDVYNVMKDYRTAAAGWGADIDLKPYTDEKITAEALKAGQCDGAVLTGLRVRQFNHYSGSMEAIGAIPDYEHLRTVIQVLSSDTPSINEKLTSGPYTIGGLMPMGAAYLFVKDRAINNVNALSGKSISVMEYDPAQAQMAAKVGMSPVLSDITNFAGRFNNNSVDICFAPVVAYSALELYKGLQPDGGIIRYTLGQLTTQIVLRKDRFSEDFVKQSRKFMFGQFDRAMTIINNAENEVDKKWWIELPEEDKRGYDEMLREARIEMTQDGIYSKDLTNLLLKVRCKYDPSRAECANPQE